MTLYFAFGSNMNSDQMSLRCPNSTCLGPAILPCHRLSFGGYSQYRQGGVATVLRGGREVQTPGILWNLGDNDLARLNRYEGVPFMYRQVPIRVRYQGLRIRAMTYKLVDSELGIPHRDYWQSIRDIYQDLEWDTSDLDKLSTPKHHVFVYGSLRKGSTNHRRLKHATFVRKATTSRSFKLLNLGAFPGMVAGNSEVHGEVWRVDDMLREELDQFEGHPTLFKRSTIQLSNKEEVDAYLFRRHSDKLYPVVRSGDWLARNPLFIPSLQ